MTDSQTSVEYGCTYDSHTCRHTHTHTERERERHDTQRQPHSRRLACAARHPHVTGWPLHPTHRHTPSPTHSLTRRVGCVRVTYNLSSADVCFLSSFP
mmetsp:Transcript_1034/g.2298  ORF Transcript_1034/g.2298 Transcript_1034/m.2298 type:complete len:98 (+) Transcript_1034:493-786(+)